MNRNKFKVIVSVTSNIAFDQRVQKECKTLIKLGYDVTVIHKKDRSSKAIPDLPFKIIRIDPLFKRGTLMYAMFNFLLFIRLLILESDILWANDLDTLLPNFLISKLKRRKLIYDSHEYFTECIHKPTPKKVWTAIEQCIFPSLKNVITVNHSIRKAYEGKYNVPLTVVRNVPMRRHPVSVVEAVTFFDTKKVLLIQGTGINENRGAEEAVLAMQFLPMQFSLCFIGNGTIWNKLQQMTQELCLEGRVLFIDRVPYEEMMRYTKSAYLGLILENIHVSHEHLFALPNKLFDYLHAGLPVVATPAVEVEKVIRKYDVGIIVEQLSPPFIADKIIALEKDAPLYKSFKQNAQIAAEDHCWENEEKKIMELMKNIR